MSYGTLTTETGNLMTLSQHGVFISYVEELNLGILNTKIKHKVKKEEHVKELDKFHVNKDKPSRELYIGHELSQALWSLLVEFLQQNLYISAWSHEDTKEINPRVTYHRLNIDP